MANEFKLSFSAAEIDEKLRKVDTLGGAQSDWNQTDSSAADFIKNKPFGEGYGDTLTIEAIDLDTFDPSTLVGEMFLKVCDTVVTMDDLSNGYVFQLLNEVAEVPPEAVGETAMQIADGICTFGEVFISIEEQGVGVDVDGMVFPESGLYMIAELLLEVGGSLTIPNYTGFPVTKKIEEKYLPGAVILYADAEAYLYATDDTSDTSKRMTVAELKKIVLASRRILINIGFGQTYCYHAVGSDIGEYGQISVVMGTTEQAGIVHFYTAEYTAS